MKGYRAKSGIADHQRHQREIPGRPQSVHGLVGPRRAGGEPMRTRVLALLAALGGCSARRHSRKRRRGPGIPRGADGKPDFSGIWQSLSGADYGLEPHLATKDGPPGAGVVEGNVIPYQPAALAAAREKLRRARNGRSANQVLYARNAARHLQQ